MHDAVSRFKRYQGVKIETDVGNPSPFRGDVVTPGARSLLELGQAHGFECQIVTLPDRCEVQGIDRARRIGFRAVWVRRRTIGGLWYAPTRFEYEEDVRPFGVDKTALVALKGKRHPRGATPYRLRQRESPLGMPVNVTELERKVREHE
jgi:hypothetical protein